MCPTLAAALPGNTNNNTDLIGVKVKQIFHCRSQCKFVGLPPHRDPEINASQTRAVEREVHVELKVNRYRHGGLERRPFPLTGEHATLYMRV